MAHRILHIIENAYRATLEEQDDPVVWLTHAMKGAGADIDVVLRGNAVNYAVKGQDASGLAFGERKQTQPPRLADDLAAFAGKGVTLYIVEDDVSERGIDRRSLIESAKLTPRSGLPKLMAAYDHVFHW